MSSDGNQNGSQTFLRFEGVMSAFYVWVNGQRVGYKPGSKTHDYALKEEEGKTFLNINCAVMGLGNSSCGPGVLKKYAIDPNKKHQLRIRILD